MTQHALTTLSNNSSTLLTPYNIHSGMDITIQNVDTAAYVYVGGQGVSATNYGYRISPNNAISFELGANDSLYAVSDTNGSKIAIIKLNLESGA